MPTIHDDRCYLNTARARGIMVEGPMPVFSLYMPAHDPGETSGALRAAFAFLRLRGDRRYSANSLIKLLNYADRLDNLTASGQAVNADEFPQVLVAEVPYNYDEETEVKQGGTVGVAVLLPDNRLMLAVHNDKRRQKVGTSMYQFVCRHNTSGTSPTIWVHQENQLGAMFCLSIHAMPRQMNNSGAVAYCERYIDGDTDNMAVVETEEWQLNEQLEQQSRRNRPSRASRTSAPPPRPGRPEGVVRGASPAEMALTLSELRATGRTVEIADDDDGTCGDPNCNELVCRNARSESRVYEDIADYSWDDELAEVEQADSEWYDHVPPRVDNTPFVLTTNRM